MWSSDAHEPQMKASLTIGVALKWSPGRAEVDPLTGIVETDRRLSGPSDADMAALEIGLRLAEAWAAEVVVATVGPPEADLMLRDALAVGASRAVRCPSTGGASSEAVAAALIQPFARASLIVCGDRSTDRGSGSVPAFLAAKLGAAQALGLVDLQAKAIGALSAIRRLDGGRRERLRVAVPAVISVEGAVARLRRASLGAVLRSRAVPIELSPPVDGLEDRASGRYIPYRPPSRVFPPPPPTLSALGRILALTGVSNDAKRAQVLALEPAEAAERILAQLRDWGYLE